MKPEDLGKTFLDMLPVIISIAAGLGLFKLAAAVGKKFIALWRSDVLKSPSKVDDAFLLPVFSAADNILDQLGEGKIDLDTAKAKLEQSKRDFTKITRIK